jgi:hypothetical protein
MKKETITPASRPKQKRKRSSKLDKVYYSVASLILSNSLAKEKGRPTLSLDNMAVALKKEHGVQIDKSSISRYLAKHKLLKVL